MPLLVVNGANTACTFGMSPSTLVIVPPGHDVTAVGMLAANIGDHISIENVVSFGMCMSLGNPEVASATSAAMGVLTPMPCIPNTETPWAPGAVAVTLMGIPALNNISTCECMYGGVISITEAGQLTVSTD